VGDRGTRVRTKPFLTQARIAAERAGGLAPRSGRPARQSTFGRGRAASFAAAHRLAARSRGAVVKARVVRHRASRGLLTAHLGYLCRDGVTRNGEAGRMFDSLQDDVDHRAFAGRCDEDRHHFRFIVSPDDASELADLKAFTRDLMTQVEEDLGTRLDWAAVDHWNTDHPHIHVIVRGTDDSGRDLVISRDYISRGMQARAAELTTMELGLRTDVEIHRDVQQQVGADRFTKLDRVLFREAAQQDWVVDLRPGPDGRPDRPAHSALVGRMRRLERLGLAMPLGPAQWQLSERAEPTLRALGERNDVIKRIHLGLSQQRIERSVSSFVIDESEAGVPIVGRLIARGLDDELKGTAYAVIDGIDGRTHHVRVADLEATTDAAPGAIVELRRFVDGRGRSRTALAVRSDLPLSEQVGADGATWLDRQLVAREPVSVSFAGFGHEVREAMTARTNHLIASGLACREGQGVVFARDLLATLRRGEVDSTGADLSSKSGLSYHAANSGDFIAGTYRCRLDLASGRFAMIDDGLGFSLVPWSPSLERQLGRQVEGIARSATIEWTFGRSRGPTIG
jgi:type IV secretory pathway VirD2 relaxase